MDIITPISKIITQIYLIQLFIIMVSISLILKNSIKLTHINQPLKKILSLIKVLPVLLIIFGILSLIITVDDLSLGGILFYTMILSGPIMVGISGIRIIYLIISSIYKALGNRGAIGLIIISGTRIILSSIQSEENYSDHNIETNLELSTTTGSTVFMSGGELYDD